PPEPSRGGSRAGPRPPGGPAPPPRAPAPPPGPPPRQQPLAGPLRGAGKPVLLRIAARHRDQAQGQVGPVFAAQQPVPGDDRLGRQRGVRPPGHGGGFVPARRRPAPPPRGPPGPPPPRPHPP